MKKSTFFNTYSRLFLIMLMVVSSVNAWGAKREFIATCTVQSIPSNAGWVYVSKDGQTSWPRDRHNDSSSPSYTDTRVFSSNLDTEHTFDFYCYQEAVSTDYAFKGWSTSSSANSGATSTSNYTSWFTNYPYYPFSITVSGTNSTNSGSATYYAIYAKYIASTTELDFGDVTLNSGSQEKTFTIACHNVGTSWSKSGLSGVLSASFSNNKTDESEHTCTVTVTLDPKTLGSYNQTLSVTTPRGGTINVTVKAAVVTNFYTKAVAHAVPSVGKVWVGVGLNTAGDGTNSRGWSNPGTANTYDWTLVAAPSAPTYKYRFYKEDPTGYSFDGWYRDADCTNKRISDAEFVENVTATTTEKTDLEYWAHWSPNTYTVNFFQDAGSTANKLGSCIVTYDAKYSDATGWIETPTKTGYTFAGWYKNDGTTLIKGSDVVKTTANLAIYAHWTANQYDVTLNANGGSGSDQIVRATFNADMPNFLKAGGAIATPIRTDYTFVGYYDATTDGTQYYNADLTSARTWNYASNKTLYAHWEATYYGRAESYSSPAVAGGTWVSCNGNKPSQPEHYKAEDSSNWQSATTLSAPTTCSAYFEESQADGYKFVGWYTGENGTGDLKSSAVYYTEDFLVTAVNTNPRTTIKRYAYFVPVTVESVETNTSPLSFTAPGNQTATVVFNVTNADATDDFTKAVSGEGWEFASWSYANNQVSIVVRYTATATTTQGEHSGTVTLTSKAANGTFKQATVVANVNLSPSINANLDSKDFGQYVLAHDTKKSHAITLSFNANAVTFEKTSDADLDPFSAVFSGDHQTLTVYFEPKAEGSYSKDLVVTVKNSQATQLSATKTIHLTGTAIRNTSTINCAIADHYMVDAPALNLASLWTSTSDGEITYSMESFTPSSTNNSGLVSAPTLVNNQLSLGQAGTVVLTLNQPQTTNYNAVNETKTITIHKYNSTFAGVENIEVKVDANVVSGYTLTYMKPESSYVGAANHEAGAPALGENSGNWYYTLEQNVTSEVTTGSPDASLAITYAPGTKTATGKNQGVATVSLEQKETYKYTAASAAFYVTVSKYDNAFTCSWDEWNKSMDLNSSVNVTLGTTNTNYTNAPIQITQTYGENTAVLTSNSATSKTITTNSTRDFATWLVYQPEDYKFYSAEADLMVMVGVSAPPTCYLLEDNTTHSFSTSGTDFEGHYDTPIAINGPTDRLWFTATRQFGGVNYFIVQYSVDNGSNWRTICNPSLEYWDKDFGPYNFAGLQANERVTHIRFGATVGATLTKWYKNIKVSRKSYLKLQDNQQNEISSLSMPTNTVNNSVSAKFYIDYSTCAENITLESNNSHFTLSTYSFTADGDNYDQAKKEITVYYTNTVASKDTAIITVYTGYQRRVLRVVGETNLRTQTLDWKEGYNTNPITVPVGLSVATFSTVVTASSGNNVTFTSGNASIVQITNEGAGFEIVGAGTTTITASAAGDNTIWKPVSESRTITATDKIIQEISWTQAFSRSLDVNDEVELDAQVYLRNVTTGSKEYSAERTAELHYTAALNNSVVTVSGTTMRVIGYGTTTITASVAGNEDYEAAAPITILITIRQPSTGCETPLVLDRQRIDTLFSTDFNFSTWVTVELQSAIIALDASNGAPDKLSLQYAGEEYIAPVIGTHHLGGTIKVQQRIGVTWYDIEGTRVQAANNEWRALSNIQLDEHANAIRFVREEGGTGYHYFKDVQITLRHYMSATNTEIDLGDVRVGEVRNATISFDYSDVKGDLTVTKSPSSDETFTLNETSVELDCGAHGTYELPVTLQPTAVGSWSSDVTIADPLGSQSITLHVTATITKGTQSIIWNPTLTINNPSEVPLLNATSSAGQPVSYAVTAGGDVASIVNGQVVLNKTGTFTITVTAEENTNYEGATLSKTFTVTNVTFVYTGVGHWEDTENWTAVPTGDAPDVIVSGALTIDEDITVGSLTIENTGSVAVTVSGSLTVNGESASRTAYGDLHVENGGALNLGNSADLQVNNFILDAALGDIVGNQEATSGQVTNPAAINVDGNVYFDLKFDPGTRVTFGWYDFTVPFDVNIAGGIYRLNNDGTTTLLVSGRDFIVARYDEARRAAGQKGWVAVNSGSLSAGVAYTITLDDDVNQNVIRFVWNKNNALGASYSCPVALSANGAAKDRGWNGLGNGTMTHTQLNGLPADTKIQMYDHNTRSYRPVYANQYTYAVGTAFFYHAPNTNDLVLTEANGSLEMRAPRRDARIVDEFSLALVEDNTSRVADVLYVSANEDATTEYEVGHDLLKMVGTNEVNIAQMWAKSGSMQLCDIEMPLINNSAECELGFKAPKQGTYTISITRAPEDTDLYLTYNGQIIWDLTASAYTIDLAKGATSGYGLRVEARAPQVTTGVENTTVDGKSVRKVLINNTIYIVTPEGEMYDVLGKSVK